MITSLKREIADYSNSHLEKYNINGIFNSLLQRVRSNLGGSHTVVTYPPLDSLEPIDSTKILQNIDSEKSINLYQHIAYCEHVCPFCHYLTVKSGISNDDKAGSYINSLLRENDLWIAKFNKAEVDSIYIGGGTPTAVSVNQIHRLLEKLNEFNRSTKFQSCVESSPMTVGAPDGIEKLKLLRDWGIDRISIGIQSFNSGLLTRSRGHDAVKAVEAVERILGFGITTNVDLIQDIPDQTIDNIFEDIDQIERLRPHQVTWYILRLAPPTSWHKSFAKGKLKWEDGKESAKKRLIILKAMSSIGYIAKPGGRFILSDQHEDTYKGVRSGLEKNLIGVGVSAYSHAGDFLFQNITSDNRNLAIKEYEATIDSGNFAIERGFHIDEHERLVSRIVKGIRTEVEVDSKSNPNLLPTESFLNECAEFGLVENVAGVFSLTLLGRLFEEEICSLLYSSAVKQRLRAKDKFWAFEKNIQYNAKL